MSHARFMTYFNTYTHKILLITFFSSFLLHLQEIMVGSQYQAEIPAYLGRCSDDEKGMLF